MNPKYKPMIKMIPIGELTISSNEYKSLPSECQKNEIVKKAIVE